MKLLWFQVSGAAIVKWVSARARALESAPTSLVPSFQSVSPVLGSGAPAPVMCGNLWNFKPPAQKRKLHNDDNDSQW